MATKNTNGFDALTNFSLESLNPGSEGLLIVTTTPTQVGFNLGLEQEEIVGQSLMGLQVTIDRRDRASKPTMQVTFPNRSQELFGLKMGRKWEPVQNYSAAWVQRTFTVQGLRYDPVEEGFEGYGVIADHPKAKASVKGDIISTPLEATIYSAGTDIADAGKFAVGEHMAMQFSPELVGETVSVKFPALVDVAWMLSEAAFELFKINCAMLLADKHWIGFEAYQSRVNKTDGNMNLEERNISIPFSLETPDGKCDAFEFFDLRQRRSCRSLNPAPSAP